MKYQPELDGLRAVAVITVLLHHAMGNALPGGFVGVDIFFVLSGYLITMILVDEFDRDGRVGLGGFFMRRCLRLMPALFAMLAVYASAMIASAIVRDHWTHTGEHLRAALAGATYTMNWTKGLDPQFNTGWLIHTWSLGVEEQFYLVWPVMLIAALRVLGRTTAWKLCLALIIACSVWRAALWMHGADPNRTYMGLDTRFDTLQWGCLLALAPATIWGWRASRFVAVPVAVLVLSLLFLKWDTTAYQVFGMPAIAVCAAWIILAVMSDKSTWLAGMLSSPPLRYLGRISYGFYLWHFVALLVVVSVLGAGWLALVATFAMTLAIAATSYHVLEMPFLKLRSRFRGRFNISEKLTR